MDQPGNGFERLMGSGRMFRRERCRATSTPGCCCSASPISLVAETFSPGDLESSGRSHRSAPSHPSSGSPKTPLMQTITSSPGSTRLSRGRFHPGRSGARYRHRHFVFRLKYASQQFPGLIHDGRGTRDRGGPRVGAAIALRIRIGTELGPGPHQDAFGRCKLRIVRHGSG